MLTSLTIYLCDAKVRKMPKKVKEMSAAEVRRLTWDADGKPRLFAVGGVSGLLLQCRAPKTESASGGKSWVLRTVIGAKRRDIGLGGFPDVSLSDAREIARQLKEKIKEGIDPIAERREAKQELIKAQGMAITFEEAARQYIRIVKAPVLKSPKHLAQWGTSLEQYAFPVIGPMGVGDIETPHIMKVLEPIWADKTETANRVRGRIANILDWAIQSGYREGNNPASIPALKNLLPAANRLIRAKKKHHPALPVEQAYKFMSDLKGRDTITAQALHFLILTVGRSGEVRGAKWSEIDLEKAR